MDACSQFAISTRALCTIGFNTNLESSVSEAFREPGAGVAESKQRFGRVHVQAIRHVCGLPVDCDESGSHCTTLVLVCPVRDHTETRLRSIATCTGSSCHSCGCSSVMPECTVFERMYAQRITTSARNGKPAMMWAHHTSGTAYTLCRLYAVVRWCSDSMVHKPTVSCIRWQHPIVRRLSVTHYQEHQQWHLQWRSWSPTA